MMRKARILVVVHRDRIVARIGRRRVGIADAREIAFAIVAVGIDASGGIGQRLQPLRLIVREAERSPAGIGDGREPTLRVVGERLGETLAVGEGDQPALRIVALGLIGVRGLTPSRSRARPHR